MFVILEIVFDIKRSLMKVTMLVSFCGLYYEGRTESHERQFFVE